MNENDVKSRGLENNDLVDLYNFHGGAKRTAKKFVVVVYPIPAGCCATYFPETNVLVPINSVADKSNTPTSKYVVIKVLRHLKTLSDSDDRVD